MRAELRIWILRLEAAGASGESALAAVDGRRALGAFERFPAEDAGGPGCFRCPARLAHAAGAEEGEGGEEEEDAEGDADPKAGFGAGAEAGGRGGGGWGGCGS